MLNWDEILKKAIPYEETHEQTTNYASTVWKMFSCVRRAYWDRVDPEIRDNTWMLTADHGTAVGALVADYFKRAGLWVGSEVRGGDKRYNLSYRIDICVREDDIIVPVEVKSVNAKKWFRVEDEGPVFAHEVQIQCYIHFHKPEPYPYGYLLYINRNTDEVKILKRPHDPELGKRIENLIDELEFFVENESLPPKCSNERECKYCDYKNRCV